MIPEQNFIDVDPRITSTWTNGDKGICPAPEIVEIPPHYGPAPEPVPISPHYGPAPEPVPIPPYCGTPKKKEQAQIADDMARDEQYDAWDRTEQAAKRFVKKYRVSADTLMKSIELRGQDAVDHLMEACFMRGVEWLRRDTNRGANKVPIPAWYGKDYTECENTEYEKIPYDADFNISVLGNDTIDVERVVNELSNV